MIGTSRTRDMGARRGVTHAGGQVRVLVGAPQLMLRQALTAVLGTHPRLRMVGDVGSGKDALRWALEVRPDVTVLDEALSSVDGSHPASAIHAEAPDLQLVILSDGVNELVDAADYEAALAARVSKRLSTHALIDVVLRVAGGERPGHVPDRMEARPARPVELSGGERLKASERVLLELLVEGSDNRMLAERLGCTEKTIRNRLSDLYAKLHLRNRTQAALYAVRTGLVDPTDIGVA